MKKIIAIWLLLSVSTFAWADGNNPSLSSSATEWAQIKTWLSINYPKHLTLLNPGATKGQIKSIKSHLGYELPAELGAVLKINDGESKMSQGLFGGLRLLPVAEQIKEYQALLEDDGFPRGRYHPILMSGGGDFYCIDLKTKEVVEWLAREGRISGVVAKNFSKYLNEFVSRLHKGQVLSVPNIRGLVDKDDL